MTVLVAAKEGNKLVLASDRLVTMQWHLAGETTKLFKKRGFIFAGSGTWRDIQIVMNRLTVPPRNEDHSVDSYVFDVAEAIRDLMKSYDRDGKPKDMDASFLMINKDGIWMISNDYSIVHSNDFLVQGYGSNVVLGAYRALQPHVIDIEERCRTAIEITNVNTLYCGKGVDIEVIELDLT